MASRRTSLIVGFSALAVIAVSFSSAFWLQKRHKNELSMPLRIVFEGSVSGLRAGRDVTFNGVKVGDVRSVRLDNPQRIVTLALIDNTTPIRKDTGVKLEAQGLTGLVAIALKGGAANAAPVERDVDGTALLTIDMRDDLDLSQSMKVTMQNVSRLIDDNASTVKNSIDNIEMFRAVLSKNADRLDRISAGGERVMRVIDSSRFSSVIDRVPFEKIRSEMSRATFEFKELGSNFEKRMAALNADKQQMQADIARAAANLDRNPSRLIFGPSDGQAAPPSSSPSGNGVVTPSEPRPR